MSKTAFALPWISSQALALQDAPKIELCKMVLESRLSDALRAEEGLIYSVVLGYEQPVSHSRDNSYINMQYSCHPDQVKKSAEIARRVIQQLKEEGVTEKEVTYVVKHLVRRYTNAIETPDAWIGMLRLSALCDDVSPESLLQMPQWAEDLRTIDWTEEFGKLFDPSRMAQLTLLPERYRKESVE